MCGGGVCALRWATEHESDEDAGCALDAAASLGYFKKKERKRPLKRAQVGFVRLTSPSGRCLAADFSQFVFGHLEKEVLLSDIGQAPDLSPTWTESP